MKEATGVPELDPAGTLETSAGDFTLKDYRLRAEGREWAVWHTGAVLTRADENRVIGEKDLRLPYGVALWPSALALAHEVASRGAEFAGRSVLELGAGTGLPGIVAATLGARVMQTDRDELSLHLAARNAARNGVETIDQRPADWTAWTLSERHDWVIGSDILYGESNHPALRRIFEASLLEGGRVLVADPFRPMAMRFFEALEADGWNVRFNLWNVGEEGSSRPVGVFELGPPISD
jgi:predicted nicotinamide N-methyase